jgi:hypothetical protein
MITLLGLVWPFFIIRRRCHIEQPVVSIHLSNCISRPVVKKRVEELNLISPFAMRTDLPLREHEALTRVKASPNLLVATMLASDRKNSGKTEKIEGGPTCLEDEFVWEDEKGRLAGFFIIQ